MANRTTAPKVKQILETELTDENIEAYIGIATLMVDDVAAVGGVGADKLAEMERWLTAHLISVTKELKPIEEEIGNDTAVKFANVFGPGLDSTNYGQMASQMDPTGTLRSWGKKKIDITAITSFD